MKTDKYFLGIDVGSVSTNVVVINDNCDIAHKLYIRTGGNPIKSIIAGLKATEESVGSLKISAVGTTGSGRQLAGVMIGADVIKNEITSHAVAALKLVPGVRTILEIGGQDSKIIILKNGMIYDFAMNTVCAAGTGSFLDRQAARLELPIEEFGGYALRSSAPVRIAGRCAVFAESDMIHKQQTGHSKEDIINGLCEALVRNYLNNLAKGKTIEDKIVFQGGVAANVGIVAAFERALGKKIIIPEYYDVMGAYGAALLAKDAKINSTSFHGFALADQAFSAKSIECSDCSNMCEVIELSCDGDLNARWGDKCGKWSNVSISKNSHIENSEAI